MTPACIAFVKAAIALSSLVQLSTEPGRSYSSMTPSGAMTAQAADINTKDTTIASFRSNLLLCEKASPEILK